MNIVFHTMRVRGYNRNLGFRFRRTDMVLNQNYDPQFWKASSPALLFLFQIWAFEILAKIAKILNQLASPPVFAIPQAKQAIFRLLRHLVYYDSHHSSSSAYCLSQSSQQTLQCCLFLIPFLALQIKRLNIHFGVIHKYIIRMFGFILLICRLWYRPLVYS